MNKSIFRGSKVYVDLLADNGINGLIVPFLLEFINFNRVEDGNAIYGEGLIYHSLYVWINTMAVFRF
jgi:hypothetical protein